MHFFLATRIVYVFLMRCGLNWMMLFVFVPSSANRVISNTNIWIELKLDIKKNYRFQTFDRFSHWKCIISKICFRYIKLYRISNSMYCKKNYVSTLNLEWACLKEIKQKKKWRKTLLKCCKRVSTLKSLFIAVSITNFNWAMSVMVVNLLSSVYKSINRTVAVLLQHLKMTLLR